MMPDNVLSSEAVFANWLVPDDIKRTLTVDREYGGIALRDATHGLDYQVWTLVTDGTNVNISAEDIPEVTLFSGTSITEVSLAFDQNMNPFVAFVDNGQAKFWWFDTFVGHQVFTNLAGSSPRAALDDKRSLENGTSDIILAYIHNNNLCFRMQRDRYGVEYTLKTAVNATLGRIGMNVKNRLQFELVPTP